ncbi:MAG TPA: hypothetical protein VFE46_12800, partial [Pirellulales bacterium]|nr:hypothetical protein [Pirellulales bacterium]
MSAWLASLYAAGPGWGAWMWRICWQAALVIAIAWLLTLLLRQRSSRLRSWIWRLAYVKLLLLFVWTSPIRLPLLPAGQESGQGSIVESGQGSGVNGQQHQAATGGDLSSYKAATVGRA